MATVAQLIRQHAEMDRSGGTVQATKEAGALEVEGVGLEEEEEPEVVGGEKDSFKTSLTTSEREWRKIQRCRTV